MFTKSRMKKLRWWTTVITTTAKRFSSLAIVRSPQLKTTYAVFPLTTHVSWYLPSCRCGSMVTLAPPLNPPRPPPPSYTNTKKLSTILPTCTYDKQTVLTMLVKMHSFEVQYAISNFSWKTLCMVDFAPKLQGFLGSGVCRILPINYSSLHFSLPFPILFAFNYRLNVSSLLKLQTPQRNSLIIYNELLAGDLLDWENSRRFAMPLTVSQWDDIWAHKFHSDDASLPRSE